MKDLRFMRLWDTYSPLLTKTQREMTDLYFNYDLSLSEIAEEKGCSRQGVSDCLNKCRKKLEEYEEKLRFHRTVTELSLQLSFLMTDVGKWAEQAGLTAEQTRALEAVLNRDYEAEAQKAIEENADQLL